MCTQMSEVVTLSRFNTRRCAGRGCWLPATPDQDAAAAGPERRRRPRHLQPNRLCCLREAICKVYGTSRFYCCCRVWTACEPGPYAPKPGMRGMCRKSEVRERNVVRLTDASLSLINLLGHGVVTKALAGTGAGRLKTSLPRQVGNQSCSGALHLACFNLATGKALDLQNRGLLRLVVNRRELLLLACDTLLAEDAGLVTRISRLSRLAIELVEVILQ